MTKIRNSKQIRGFTLIELLVALMVTSIVLAAVATLAYALGTANETSDDTSQKQAQVRYATLRISELIRHCKLICGTPGNDLTIWRADDNNDGKINPTELVYLESGQERECLQLLEFPWSSSWNLTIEELNDVNTKDGLILAFTERRTVLVPECSNVEFQFDVSPPQSEFVSISFDITENDVVRQYEISSTLRGRAGHLLDGSGNIVSDDD